MNMPLMNHPAKTAFAETALSFACEGEALFGVLSLPAAQPHRRGVLIVVGGPQ